MNILLNDKTGYLIIEDETNQHEHIFIQGGDYTQFMREVNRARTSLKMEKEEAVDFVAKEYAGNLW